MPIPTSRTNENGTIEIDSKLCTACGTCAELCSCLKIENKTLNIYPDNFPGCIACGLCMAICPKNAISISGREFNKSDIVELPSSVSSFDDLNGLMLKRRSIRNFQDKEVPQNIINQIIEASTSAPMGIPPSDVKVLVLQGKHKVREFSFDYLTVLEKMSWFFSPIMLALLRPFIGKEGHAAFKSFIAPLFKELIRGKKENKDLLLYDAPLAMYFYTTPYSDVADPTIACTYAMLAAESLGLGSCMIGSIAPLVKRAPKWFKDKYGLKDKEGAGLVIIFGYPKFKFKKAIKRTFAGVKRI